MVLEHFLDPILDPLLLVGPFFAILIISLIVSIFTTLIHKFTTDQDKLKQIRSDLKAYQEKIKRLKDNPEKALSIQKEMMAKNGEMMKLSFRPMFFTFIPLLLFLGWLSVNMAFVAIHPNTNFEVNVVFQEGITGNVVLSLPDNVYLVEGNLSQQIANNNTWILKGDAGEYNLEFTHGESGEVQVLPVLITTGPDYLMSKFDFDESSNFKSIGVKMKKLLVFEGIPLIGQIPWIKTFGWFGAYFLMTIITSTIFRKIFKLA